MFDFYRPLHKFLLHPLWRWKEGMHLQPHLRMCERAQYLPASELKELQFARLQDILRHAYENCPFYRRRWDEWGTPPETIRSIEDLQRLPIVRKADIQAHAEDMVARNHPPSDVLPNWTGGSTGKPLRMFVNRARWNSRMATGLRHDRWSGYDIGDKRALFWGSLRDNQASQSWRSRLRQHWMERLLLLDTGNVTEEKLEQFVRMLRRFHPQQYVGYANSLHLFARYLLETGKQVPPVNSIISSAEMLLPAARPVIESAFGTKIFDRYGCREVSVIASECERHSLLHISADTLVVEFMRGERPAAPGEEADLLVTDLFNRAMPLIRYAIEDRARPSNELCPCGRTLPLMHPPSGRVTDFIYSPDGRIISGIALALPLVGKVPGLRQVQLVQETLDSVRFRFVPAPDFSPQTMEFLDRWVPEYLGTALRVDYEMVDEIPAEPSGKYRLTISKIMAPGIWDGDVQTGAEQNQGGSQAFDSEARMDGEISRQADHR